MLAAFHHANRIMLVVSSKNGNRGISVPSLDSIERIFDRVVMYYGCGISSFRSFYFFLFFLRNSCDVNAKLLKLFFNYVLVKEFYILYLYFYVETKYKIN